MNDVVSGYRIQQALSSWQSARARLLREDAELAHDEAMLAELLGDETENVQDILARLLRAAVHATAMASAAADQIETIKGRQDRYKRRAETMRSTAYAIFDAVGTTKMELPDLTASIRRGTQSAMIIDEAAVPDKFVEIVTTRKIDKAVVLSTLKAGEEVPGCFLSNGLPSLAIRTK
jgi:Gp157 protein